MTPKQRLYATLTGSPRDRVPVTPIFMAWAAHHIGRSYRDYYLDANVRAASQIAVARDLGTDQVSVISDPWCEASAYGMEFDWPDESVGVPHAHLLHSPDDGAMLRRFDPHHCPRTADRIEAVRLLARQIGDTHSVMGWVEGPIAEYSDLRGVQETMIDLIDAPDAFNHAAEVLVECAAEFGRAQIEAGADFIGVGDAAASLVGPEIYREHVLPWQRRLIAAIHDAGGKVKLHVCGNIASILPHMATTGADVIDVDWMVPLAAARAAVGPLVTLCGNFNPVDVLLHGSPESVAAAARDCLAQAGDRFILQPGCEVPPGTPRENLQAFCPGKGCLIEAELGRVSCA
jgi:uroporphyrinogen decarboxylase